jgi:hypothetical protein
VTEVGKLTVIIENDGFAEMAEKKITTIKILGTGPINTVLVNGIPHPAADFEVFGSGILIKNLAIVANSPFTLEYNNTP